MSTKIKEDILIRMQNDLKRALTKPVEKRKWAMLIDLRKCVGCHACTIACKAENVLPPGVVYRRVLEIESGKYPDVERHFVPVLCNHCDKTPCVDACPVKATKKRVDGIVDIDYNHCIGCRACLNACPYGARTSDFGKFYTQDTPKIQPYELRPAFEYQKKWYRKKGNSPIGNARKCHFCLHRIESGLLPECVVTCIGKATYFGDIEDKSSLIFEIINSNNVKVLKEKLKLKPRVYYIGLKEELL